MFREFLTWIVETDKKFLIIGNMNAIKYKGMFPLLRENRIWLGATGFVSDMVFAVPNGATVKDNDREKAARLGYVGNFTRLGNSCWYTNLEHGRRHQELQLMTERENIKFSKHKEVRSIGYLKYVNFDGIEVPYTDAIPSDYEGVMGVPISFMDKYCPDQFEIVGMSLDLGDMEVIRKRLGRNDGGPTFYVEKDGQLVRLYDRIAIRHRKPLV